VKNLYDLKQVNKQCNEKLTVFIFQHDYAESKTDYFIFLVIIHLMILLLFLYMWMVLLL